MIEQKTNELGRFLIGKKPSVQFVEPAPQLERQDIRELRAKILILSASEAKRIGIQKSTLHYLRRRAKGSDSFRVYNKLVERLAASGI